MILPICDGWKKFAKHHLSSTTKVPKPQLVSTYCRTTGERQRQHCIVATTVSYLSSLTPEHTIQARRESGHSPSEIWFVEIFVDSQETGQTGTHRQAPAHQPIPMSLGSGLGCQWMEVRGTETQIWWALLIDDSWPFELTVDMTLVWHLFFTLSSLIALLWHSNIDESLVTIYLS